VDDTNPAPALTFGPGQVPLSVLDTAPVPEGGDPGGALRATTDLARHAERLGFRRYWVAEHHNMPGIASSTPPVLIGHIADATQVIRVGSGGVMLPNHVSLVVAEQFGTLEAPIPAGSTSASAARPVRIRSRRPRCAAHRRRCPRTTSPISSWTCSASSPADGQKDTRSRRSPRPPPTS
jgi:Luciferase-like monooxygenase